MYKCNFERNKLLVAISLENFLYFCNIFKNDIYIYFFIVVKPPIRRVHTIYTYIKMVIKAVSIFPCHKV